MHINKTRHNNMLLSVNNILRSVLFFNFLKNQTIRHEKYRGGKNINNTFIVNNNRVVLVNSISRNNRNNPSSINNHRDCLHRFSIRKQEFELCTCMHVSLSLISKKPLYMFERNRYLKSEQLELYS